jgi:hypothetical protein
MDGTAVDKKMKTQFSFTSRRKPEISHEYNTIQYNTPLTAGVDKVKLQKFLRRLLSLPLKIIPKRSILLNLVFIFIRRTSGQSVGTFKSVFCWTWGNIGQNSTCTLCSLRRVQSYSRCCTCLLLCCKGLIKSVCQIWVTLLLNVICGNLRHIHRLNRSGLHSLSLCPSRHEDKNCLCYNKDHQRPTVCHTGHTDKKPRGENVRVEQTIRYTDILTQTAALYRHRYRQVSAGIPYRQTVP